MFGCSPFFVGMAAPLTKGEVKEVFKKKEEEKEGRVDSSGGVILYG